MATFPWPETMPVLREPLEEEACPECEAEENEWLLGPCRHQPADRSMACFAD